MAKGNGGTRSLLEVARVDPRSLYWNYSGSRGSTQILQELGYDYGEKPRIATRDIRPVMWYATGSTAYNPQPEFYKEAMSFPEKTIKVNDLIPSIQQVHKDTVVDYYLNPDKESSTGPIIGLKVYGTKQYVIANGHHRVIAAMMRGEKSVKMRIYNAPKRFFKGLQNND